MKKNRAPVEPAGAEDTLTKRQQKKLDRQRATEGAGSSWTAGREKASRLIQAVCVATLLCGPVALGYVLMNSAAPIPVAAAVEHSGPSVVEQSAGDYAVGVVTAWLRATREEPGALSEYLEVDSSSLSEHPWEYRDVTAGAVEVINEDAAVATVSANVRQVTYNDDNDKVETWPRRTFQVPLLISADTVTATALPSMIAPGESGARYELSYSHQASPNDTVGQTVTSFLLAYLADASELDRYLSPGAEIHAITPAPYMQVQIDRIRTTQQVDETPDDGDQIHVLADVVGIGGEEQVLPATYALSLTARAGRWEISDIDSSPQLRLVGDGSTTPTPTPTASTK